MTARELLNKRIAMLRAKELESLIPAVQELANVLGDVELTRETERFLSWFTNWDPSSMTGLAALIADRDAARGGES